jgi:hypothetical protein
VAVNCTGQTDMNPVGAVGKVAQLLFSLIAPGQVVVNLMAAAVVGAGAYQVRAQACA